MADSPFHAGERAVQQRVGVRARLESIGQRTIRGFMPDEHREFFEELPFVILSAHDARLWPWASILVGRPGFAHSPDPVTAQIDALPGPPTRAALVEGAPVGVLGIQLDTRRRNRVNGRVRLVDDGGFSIHVDQSFGNCPQYIQARTCEIAGGARVAGPARPEGAVLSQEAVALIRRADTFFIASAARPDAHGETAADGLDASHRGGKPGFVRADVVGAEAGAPQTRLTWPEFRGNFYFNTLGNIAENPRTGLLFVDFDSGDCLSLTGEAEIVWDAPEIAKFARAERFVRFRVTEGTWQERAVPLRWSSPEQARELPATGDWGADRPTE
jgi:predicted pyridoxine 5'-phosphate oxidase superfamily flavin-nucleotide-binding protein